jgi:hypothetical protein
MNERSLDHERHDALLVAAHAAGDLTGPDRDLVARLLVDCRACATLADDLRALAIAVQDLPPPTRPRDFTISQADSRRLRRGGWGRFVELVRGDAFRLARPVGAAFASLGFAGLVFASMAGGAPPGAAGAASGGTPGPYEALQATDVTAAAGADGHRAGAMQPSAEALDAQQQPAEPNRETTAEPDAGEESIATPADNDAMIVLSGSLFIVGVGLFGVRWTATRLGDG